TRFSRDWSSDVCSSDLAGQNTLAVRVYDPAQDSIRVPRWFDGEDSGAQPFDPRLIPHGKQEWYYNVGGIWQDVTLTALPSVYIQIGRASCREGLWSWAG